MSITIVPIAGALGAEIHGADPRDPDLDFGSIHKALLDYEVIFFREVNLNEDEHLAFGAKFGTPSIYPVAKLMGETTPKLTVFDDLPDRQNVTDNWHTDVTWITNPPDFALLHMEVRPERGGDTLWGSATRAYETLSPKVQEFLCGLTVTHDNEGVIESLIAKTGDPEHFLIEGLRRDYPPVVHPLVRTHPETGKRAIVYSKQFMRKVNEVTSAESRAIFDLLDHHIQNPALHCRWRWTVGDLAVWDERSTIHRSAGDHFGYHRTIRRLEIDGEQPYFDPDAVVKSA